MNPAPECGQQSRTGQANRTLWLCLHLHRLALDAVTRSLSVPGAIAVSDQQGSKRWIADCHDTLAPAGICPGLGLASAYALVPELLVYPRQPRAEQRALHQVATWAYGLSSQVSVSPPDMVLAEISGSLRLLGQQGPWRQVLKDGLMQLGYQASLSLAPTPAAARVLARAGRYRAVVRLDPLPEVLRQLPLSACEFEPKVRQQLESMGLNHLSELLALPRDGIQRRFGQVVLTHLDQICGKTSEVLSNFQPPSTFSTQLELSSDVENAEALLFACQRLLIELGQFLRLRDQAVAGFRLGLEHPHGEITWLQFGLLELERDSQRLLDLMKERLHHLQLSAPVRQLMLEARRLFAYQTCSDDLFDNTAPLQQLSRLLERLRSRLGEPAVHGLSEYADHRPEQTTRAWPVNEPSPACDTPVGPRPVWLLAQAQALAKCPGRVLAGPERVESGWWDGVDVQRDYYVVENRPGERLWVYQERRSKAWFKQGVFS